MDLNGCEFETERLLVREWHALVTGDWQARDLAETVAELLTPAVTHALPPDWGGEYDAERARRWIADRDAEGVTLLVVERSSGDPVGLLILTDGAENDGPVGVRLGYLLVERGWGRGLGSELVAGFVGWCRENGVASISGGVAIDNPASARVLVKNGFQPVQTEDAAGMGEQLFRLDLSS
ncbi:MAG: GNAT family N-acetyltransferase [Dehalococcoidia bacterium]|jgi:[ribosomal protein S5]-alanine N-acetyltransferase|nr:GNAT family N-acetyltransferase [Dehalococcoidia bacterium]